MTAARPTVKAIARLVGRLGNGDLYLFLPPLPEVEVARLEATIGVGLPREYRTFLRRVSAGGQTTRLGPPELWTPDRALESLRAQGGHLDRRFPISNAVAQRLIKADTLRRKGQEGVAVGGDISDGVLPLMDHGCGTLDLLVVTGPQRGKVWQAWERGWSPLHHRVGQGEQSHGFLSWLSGRLSGT
jgi:hypothetical protein